MTQEWLHFVGIAGSGMSALAQYHALQGGRATGSDRAFDQGLHPFIRSRLEAVGVEILPQDGRAIGSHMTAVIASTAIESSIPDLVSAVRLKVPIRHRSELLADYVAASRTIAISGTSGKSTVAAMLFELLQHCGLKPSVLTGGDLRMLQTEGRIGNAWVGESDLLVIEADESDGSLVRYQPWAGVLLNLQRDHKEIHELEEIFHMFRAQTSGPFLVGDDPNLDAFGTPPALRFGICEGRPETAEDQDGGAAQSCEESGEISQSVSRPQFQAVDVELGPESSTFRMIWPTDPDRSDRSRGHSADPGHADPGHANPKRSANPLGRPEEDPVFQLPVPGQHNVCNATAALAVGYELGLSPKQMRDALAKFAGVSRRFQKIGSPHGIDVFDDFGHNPRKIEATLRTARLRAGENRILAAFQPHGFRPTAFIRDELVETLVRELRPGDHFWFLDIFYAGGTAERTITAPDIVADLQRRGAPASYAKNRVLLVEALTREAGPGDQVLVLGARDPSLTELAEQIVQALKETDRR